MAAYQSPSKMAAQLPDDIRIRYIFHSDSVKHQVVALFTEQTNWLVDHLESIRKTYESKKTAPKKAARKGGKRTKAQAEDARPALAEIIKSPRKRTNSQQSTSRVPQVVVPKLTLAPADTNIQRQKTPDSFGPASAPIAIKATPGGGENAHQSAGGSRSRKPASAKADKSLSSAPPRSPLSPLSPRRTPNALSPPPASRSPARAVAAQVPSESPARPAAAASAQGKSDEAEPVNPAEQTGHDLSAIEEDEEEEAVSPKKSAETQVQESAAAAESAVPQPPIPEADEDEPVARPRSVAASSEPQSADAQDVEMAVPLNDYPSTLGSSKLSLPSSTHRTPGQKSQSSIFAIPATTGNRKQLLPSSTANAALPPSPSSTFLGKMGLGLGRSLGAPTTLPMQLSATTVASTHATSSRASIASAVFSSQNTAVTSTTSLGSQTSPTTTSQPLPTLGGVFGIPSVGALGLKRTSAAADLPTAGAKDPKVSRVDGQSTNASGAARLESVKEALVKMRTQRNSTMGGTLLRTSQLDVLPRSSIAAPSVSIPAIVPAPAAPALTAPSAVALQTLPTITVPTPAPIVTPTPMEVEPPKPVEPTRDSHGSSINSDLAMFPAPPSTSSTTAAASAPVVTHKEPTPQPVIRPVAPTPELEAVAAPAQEPRRISALPKRVSGGLRKRSSVGDLVAQFEKRRESIEAEQAIVPPGRRVSTPPTVSLPALESIQARQPSPLAKEVAPQRLVAPPHPATTPPGSPPTMRIDATHPDLADVDAGEDVHEMGFEEGMIIEDSMAQLEDVSPEGIVDGTDVIATQPIDFFDASGEPEIPGMLRTESRVGFNEDLETGVVADVEDATLATQTHDFTAPLKPSMASTRFPQKSSFAPSEASYVQKSNKSMAGADENNTAEISRKPMLKKVPSSASLASTKSQGSGLMGVLSKASSVLTTTWGAGPKGKPEVKSLQLAAAAAKREQEEKERRAALKEERRLLLEKKQAEERARSEETQKSRMTDAERRRKEELAKKAAFKPKVPISRQVSEEPKKRKVDAEPRPTEIKKPKPTGPVAGPSALKHSASTNFQPTRPAPPASGAIKPSAAAAAAVGVKTMSESIRLVGQPVKPKPAVNYPSSATKTPLASSSNAVRHVQPQGLSVHPSQVFPQPSQPAAAAGPSKAAVATPEAYIELPDIDSEYSDDDEEEQERKNAALPQWAQSPFLREALDAQAQIDPADIFGPIPDLKMEELFKSKSGRFRMRTSSANWAGTDGLTAYEEAEYARRMGYRSAQAQKQQR